MSQKIALRGGKTKFAFGDAVKKIIVKLFLATMQKPQKRKNIFFWNFY